jgi:hypothetical protein
MKLNGIMGKGSGKLGSSVWGISGGVQVVREYNPVVTNPQTVAQTEQRAKFKLMTQLAAAMSGQIAFRKSELTSARNKFVSYNISKTYMNNEKAQVDLRSLSLTGSSISIGEIVATRTSEEVLSVAFADAMPANISKVVYVVYKSDENDQLQFIAEQVVSEAGPGRTFPTTSAVPNETLVVFAYGIIETSQKAKVVLENYIVNVADDMGFVNILRSLTASDYKLTATASTLVGEM